MIVHNQRKGAYNTIMDQNDLRYGFNLEELEDYEDPEEAAEEFFFPGSKKEKKNREKKGRNRSDDHDY